MIRNFNTTQGIVVATVTRVPNADWFFVQNGSPEQIFCHCNQGGSLALTQSGAIVMNQNQRVYPPSLGDKVVLVSDSSQVKAKAACWAPKSDWDEVSWAVNAYSIFLAVAFNHRCNGKFQSNTKQDVGLVEDCLINICRKHPHNAPNDTLRSGFTSKLGALTLSYDVLWSRLEKDGTWTECKDPRPTHANKF